MARTKFIFIAATALTLLNVCFVFCENFGNIDENNQETQDSTEDRTSNSQSTGSSTLTIGDLFDHFDQEKLGKIKLEKFTQTLSRDGVTEDDIAIAQQFFYEADDNNDERLSKDEFIEKLEYVDDDGGALNDAAEQADSDNAGQIFLAYLRSLQSQLENEGSTKPRCNEGFFKSGEFCYKKLSTAASYDEAMLKCIEENADLPTFQNDIKEWRLLQEKMNAKNYLNEGQKIWLRLRRPDNNWLWQDTFPTHESIALDGTADAQTTSATIRCAVARINSTSANWKVLNERATGWEDSECWERKGVLVVCQQPQEIRDIDVANLNGKLTDDDLYSDELIIRSGPVKAGRTKKQLGSLSKMLSQLNQNYYDQQYNDDANGGQTNQNGKSSEREKAPQVATALSHDAFPVEDCLRNRIRNTQCATSQGKRRRKRGCNDRRRKRNMYSEKFLGWTPKPAIRYAFEKKLWKREKTQKLIRKVMDYWSKQTCVDFVEDNDTPQVVIVRKKGCWSSIGRDLLQNGENEGDADTPQLLSIGPGCDRYFTIAHELGHLLGLEHEQSRSDRDRHVKVLYENVEYGSLYNFDVCDECCRPHVYSYDYGSIMHYSPKEFAKAKDVLTIMDTKDGRYNKTMGNSWIPSFYDVFQANKMLCYDQCDPDNDPDFRCVNGGYPHPRDCKRCICPTGFGGTRCQRIDLDEENSCGSLLQAQDSWESVSTPGYPKPSLRKGDRCTWIIKAPRGMSVEVKVENTTFSFPVDCRFGNVQIKFQTDLAVSGVQYCGRQPPVQSIVSEGELMIILVQLFEDIGHVTSAFKGNYRAVKRSGNADAETSKEQSRFFDVADDGADLDEDSLLSWPVSTTVYKRTEREKSGSASGSSELDRTGSEANQMEKQAKKENKPFQRDSSSDEEYAEDTLKQEEGTDYTAPQESDSNPEIQ